MITLALFVSLLLAATTRYSGKYVHLIYKTFSIFNFIITERFLARYLVFESYGRCKFFKNFFRSGRECLEWEVTLAHPETTTAAHGTASVNYHLPLSATDYNTYNDLDHHPIIALFFIVKSQESKVPNLILFSFGMSRGVERIWRLLLQGYG